MTPTLFVGFAAIGGILAGYGTARLAPPWALWSLWGVCALSGVALAIWLQSQGPGNEIGAFLVFFGGFVPFAGCVIVAGVIGLVVRRTIAKDPGE